MKKIAVIFWEDYLTVAPTVINSIILFKKNGFEVEIFTYSINSNYAQSKSIKDFKINKCKKTTIESKIEIENTFLKKLIVFKNIFLNLFFKPNFSITRFICLLYLVLKNINKNDYSYIIGIDTYGLVIAGIVSKIYSIKTIYLSLEILRYKDFGIITTFLKLLESKFHKNIQFTVIQDEERKNILYEVNKIKSVPYVLLPNSPIGEIYTKKNEYFSNKFDLQKNSKIILSAGMISPEVMSYEISKVASKFKTSELVLILHERKKTDLKSSYIQKIITNINDNKVKISLEPVPYERLDELFSSATIGLIFYNKKYGPNFEKIAYASGKVAHLLKCGIPIITIEFDGFKKLIDEFNCGIYIKTVDEIEDAALKILDTYDTYRKNAFICYEKRYRFDIFFRNIIEKIKEDKN